MSNLAKKIFRNIAIGCILIISAISKLKADEITPQTFKPWLNTLKYIRNQYSDGGAVSIIEFMIDRLEKIIAEEFEYIRDSKISTVEFQLYKALALPIVISPFYDKYKNIELFPEQVRKNSDNCKICLGKGKDGKYWCFLFENRCLVIKDYD